MSLEIVLIQTAYEKKTLPLRQILGPDMLYGCYDEGWRLVLGHKGDETIVAYTPAQIARGISVTWHEDEKDSVKLRLLTPTAPAELREFYEMVYRIATYWECQLYVDGVPMELEDFLDLHESMQAFNKKSLQDMAKNVMSGETSEMTLFSAMWPLVMGRAEAEAFLVEPIYFARWLHEKQNIDAYPAKPAFYRGEEKIIGRYAVAEEMRMILPKKPYVPYGFDDPETGEQIVCDEYGVLVYCATKDKTLAEMDYDSFIKAVKKIASSKVRTYDGNHIIVEELTVEELEKLVNE